MTSKNNLELKHFCKDFGPVRKVLKNLGAKKEIVKTQKDYFFHISPENKGVEPRLKLRIEKTGQTLVYYERPGFVKGKETAADIKLYEVKDKTLLPFLQRSLGVKAIVEKKREVWRKDHTVFHLDTVKGVGNIFEVELQRLGKITQADKKLFQEYQTTLTPVIGAVITGSNVDLVKKYN